MEKGDKGIFVMKRSLAALVLLMILACALSCAHAQKVPQAILDWMAERGYENESWDSLLFDLPDESAFAFLLNDWSLYGFLQKDGAWQNHSSGSIMSGHTGLRFERHRQGQSRADGSAWPDDLGFDIVSEDGSRLSYRYDGQWFSICGWYDPQRYPGEVIVQTYKPDSPCIQAAARQDYRAFFEQEFRRRRAGLYPPFTSLARLLVESPSEAGAQAMAERLYDTVQTYLLSHPPQKRRTLMVRLDAAPVKRIRGQFRYQVLLKVFQHPDAEPLLALLSELGGVSDGATRVYCEVNPVTLM